MTHFCDPPLTRIYGLQKHRNESIERKPMVEVAVAYSGRVVIVADENHSPCAQKTLFCFSCVDTL